MLLETLVVLFIIGVMLAILIPGIFRAREAARRTTCLNNLKNVGLALHLYQDPHKVFPPGYISRDVSANDPATSETGPGWAWGAMLLPYIDQAPLAGTINFTADPPGITALLPPFLCPADNPPQFDATSRNVGVISLSPTSYVGIFGGGSLADQPGAPNSAGIFYRNSRVSIDDIHDGISQTLLIGERSHLFTDASGNLMRSQSTWYAAPPGALPDCEEAVLRNDIQPGAFVLGTAGPGEPQSAPTSALRAFNGFSSQHTDGVGFTRVDGSVQLLNRLIDDGVFRQLCGRSDERDLSSHNVTETVRN